MRTYLFILVFYFIVPHAFAQQTIIPVHVYADSEDPIGKRLVYQIKEHINKSTSMRLTRNPHLALGLHISTEEGDPRKPASYTNFSIAYIWHSSNRLFPAFLALKIGKCGRNHINTSAELAVADGLDMANMYWDKVNALLESIDTTNTSSDGP